MPMPLAEHSATIEDVARRAGVSTATVSRVINQSGPVDAATITRVQTAMRELKYIPRTAARNLASRKTNTLGLLLTDIQGDFFAPMLSGVESAARAAGYDLLIATTNVRAPRAPFPSILGPQNTDGLLVFINSLGSAGLEHYHELGFPVVLIHQSSPEGLNIPCVTVENKAAAKKLIDHLIEVHQRRHIAFLRGPEDQQDSHWRALGYKQSLEAHGLAVDPGLIASGEFDRAIAAHAVKQLLESGVEFGVLDALQHAVKRVPEEISVVGFDDQRLSAYLTPPLTTVRAPTERVGSEAVRQLVQLIQTRQADPLTLLPTEMIIRRSCGCVLP
jgi:DNA-binding LacI/PurR family transcriptional regulator